MMKEYDQVNGLQESRTIHHRQAAGNNNGLSNNRDQFIYVQGEMYAEKEDDATAMVKE